MRSFLAVIGVLGNILLFLVAFAIVALVIIWFVYTIYKIAFCCRISDFLVCTSKNEIIQFPSIRCRIKTFGKCCSQKRRMSINRYFLTDLKSTAYLKLENGVVYSTVSHLLPKFEKFQRAGKIKVLQVKEVHERIVYEGTETTGLLHFLKTLLSKRRSTLKKMFYHIKFTRIE